MSITITIPTTSVAVNDIDTDIGIEEQAATLRMRIAGQVLYPRDPAFAASCAAWNLRFEHHPAVVVVARTANDIAEAVRFAHDHALQVTVQATGHGVGQAANGGVLIITSSLDDVTVDAPARTAHIAAGAKWGAVLGAAQQHGLAPLLGSSSGVGAVGYTLGGGMGWLARQHGLAADSVRSFDLVLADGTTTRASASEHPDLFWALRGGGAGTLAVVVAMTIELHPVGTVYAGNLLYPATMAGDVIRRYRDWVDGIDERMTSSVVLMNVPPLDTVPEPMRGKSFVIVRGCWNGDIAAGAELVDEWRTWRTPAMDMFGPMPFTAVDTISNDPVDPLPAMVTTEWFDTLSDHAIDTLIAAAGPSPAGPPMLLLAELRHAGGAIRRNASGTAISRGRTGELLLHTVALVFGPEHGAAVATFMDQLRSELAADVTGDLYPNFLEGNERTDRIAAAFADDDLERFQTIKATVDPDGRFATINRH